MNSFYTLFLCWAGWLFDFYDLMLYSFLLVPISKELGLSDMQSSLVLGFSLAMTAVGGFLFGYLSDKFGRKKMLQLTILAYSFGAFMCGFANSLAWLLVFRSITGLGVGGEWAIGQTYIAETFPPEKRGRFGAYMQTGAPLGIALASIVGSFFAPVYGWRAAFFVSVLPALLVLLIRSKMPESKLWEVTKGAKCKLSTLFESGVRKMFLLALVLAVFDMCAYWFTYSWLPTYLSRDRGFSIARSGLWIIFTQTGAFIGYVTFGHVADWIGRRPAYSIYSFMMAAGLLMITIFWDLVAATPYVLLLFMFVVGFGTGMFGGYGPLFSEIFPTRIRTTAMGTAFNLARGVQFFTPMIITIVAVNYGLAGGISLAAFFAILTGLWIWTFPETKGKVLTAD